MAKLPADPRSRLPSVVRQDFPPYATGGAGHDYIYEPWRPEGSAKPKCANCARFHPDIRGDPCALIPLYSADGSSEFC